jgi:hypothetical protein
VNDLFPSYLLQKMYPFLLLSRNITVNSWNCVWYRRWGVWPYNIIAQPSIVAALRRCGWSYNANDYWWGTTNKRAGMSQCCYCTSGQRFITTPLTMGTIRCVVLFCKGVHIAAPCTLLSRRKPAGLRERVASQRSVSCSSKRQKQLAEPIARPRPQCMSRQLHSNYSLTIAPKMVQENNQQTKAIFRKEE